MKKKAACVADCQLKQLYQLASNQCSVCKSRPQLRSLFALPFLIRAPNKRPSKLHWPYVLYCCDFSRLGLRLC